MSTSLQHVLSVANSRGQKIEWFKLTDLPTWKRSKASLGKFYLISPFIVYASASLLYCCLLLLTLRPVLSKRS